VRRICKTAVLVLCLISIVFCQTCFAGDALRKFGRGFSNVLFGWVDVPAEMNRTAENTSEVGSFIVGSLKGLAKMAGRMAVGVYEVCTFPVPVPARYDPIVEPEFVW
jgi:putative exosortase-associated protein (TIGR04073 family)